ncbi:ECF-type sigma factor [Thalassoglobus polymorphus]|uniref:ECF sigma factor n=1 Tax=Thalassoglobus polymorphus TaxID=2527994 RepID=A0A517QTB9_9PLAN|nr:ECF-type sigma factor [Thalassoglobus polymorphus]QDT34842.1 ECF sigma factor [Thalassoglobus polymorphus]
MSDVTQILNRIDEGDLSAAEDLLPLVYNELRNLAKYRMQQERGDHTLQPTALVHEAYLRLVKNGDSIRWESRGHFFTAAANAMRRILVEAARAKASQKRGGEHVQVELSDFPNPSTEQLRDQLIELDGALTVLECEDFDAAEIVKLRMYGGLSVEDAGKVLGMSRSTAYENWNYARSWFAVYIEEARES